MDNPPPDEESATLALAKAQVYRTRWLSGAVYDVRGGQSWRAVPSKGPSSREFPSSEARILRNLRHPHIVRHVRLLNPSTGPLYVLTELLPDRTVSHLVNAAAVDNLFFREGFLWRFLSQAASACKALRDVRTVYFRKLICPDHVYVDEDANVKVDPFFPPQSRDESASFVSCPNDICSVGSLLKFMVSGTGQSIDGFQHVIGELLHEVDARRACCILPDIILHHPTVLCNVDDSKEIFSQRLEEDGSRRSNDSAFESDDSTVKIDLSLPSIKSPEVLEKTASPVSTMSLRSEGNVVFEGVDEVGLSPTLLALDLKIPGYVPRKSMRRSNWSSRSNLKLNKEPKEVSEETLNRVWLERLADLRKREEAIDLKEKDILKREIFEKIRAKIPRNTINPVNILDESSECVPGITLQSVMTEKNFSVISPTVFPTFQTKIHLDGVDKKIQSRPLPKKPYRRSGSLRNKQKKKDYLGKVDMDSSLSADPGDTSVLATSTKLSAEIVPRPPRIENLARRKVHFNSRNNPFAEYESVSSTTLTFFDIENVDPTYEIPRKLPVNDESLSDKIARFSYFDLEDMTNKKRAQMEEWRKTPPKPKSVMKSNFSLAPDNGELSIDPNVEKPNLVKLRKSRRSKYLSPTLDKYSSNSHVNYCSSQSETSYKSTKSLPCISKVDNKRKSILNKQQNSSEDVSDGILSNIYNRADKAVTRASFYCVRSHFAKNTQNVCKAEGSTENKENAQTPNPNKNKKRRSILGFKTPFKFKI